MSEKAKSKSHYKSLRESLGLSREDVCDLARAEKLGAIATERLERVENGKFPIEPDEVLLLSRLYREPQLCNYYCSHECPIGKEYVPEIPASELEKIVLPMVASLNLMKQKQERLIEIAADGVIDDAELRDFVAIQKELEHISITVESLQLWTEQMIAQKKINTQRYNELKNK